MKTILYNPFLRYSEKKLLVFGILALLVACGISTLLNGRFDGVLDLHFVEKTNFVTSLLDLIIGTISITILLFIIGKIINKKTRIIDILALSLIAKIPFYFLLLFNINNKMLLVSEKLLQGITQNRTSNIETSEMLLIVFSGIATLSSLIWSFILMFNGFKTATNLKDTKHILLFIIAIIIAEILSKILISNIN